MTAKQDYIDALEQYEQDGERLVSQKGWRVLAITPGGKKIMLVPDGVYGLYEVAFETGGGLPAALRQKFTSEREAQIAVDGYMNSTYTTVKEDLKIKNGLKNASNPNKVED